MPARARWENACCRRESAARMKRSWGVKSTERGIHHRETVIALDVIHVGDAEVFAQSSGFDFQRTGLRRFAGFRLRKGRGHGGVERGVALDFFHRLMDVTVED